MLKIVHVNTERTYRGGEVQTLLLARELQSRGNHNIVVAQSRSPLADRSRESSVHTIEIKMRGEWDFLAALRLRKLFQQESPDLIHAHTPHAITLALFARRGKVPVIASRRVMFPLPNNPLTRAKYHKADAVLAVSQGILNQLVKYGLKRNRLYVAESGTDFSVFEKAPPRIDARKALELPESAFVIGNVSYFDRHKGQSSLIQAFAKLSNPNCFLLLAGDGPLLDHCRSLVQQLRVSERVLFTGYRPDVENIYAAMDLFFLSSIPPAVEGWSGVLREAMGFGLPVIAVRQPATEEQVRHLETGLLVSIDTDEWVEVLRKMYQDADLRRELASRGMAFSRQFTIQAMTEKTELCYRSVLTR